MKAGQLFLLQNKTSVPMTAFTRWRIARTRCDYAGGFHRSATRRLVVRSKISINNASLKSAKWTQGSKKCECTDKAVSSIVPHLSIESNGMLQPAARADGGGER